MSPQQFTARRWAGSYDLVQSLAACIAAGVGGIRGGLTVPTRPVERFISALQEAEQSGDAGPLVGLFAEDAEISSPERGELNHGAVGASRFWHEYLRSFGRVRSEFTRDLEAGGVAVLEWVSRGSLPGGEPVRYEGVSILEFDGDRVKRFRTYYDSAALRRPDAAPPRTLRNEQT